VGTKALDAQVRWTRWFMWFGSPEHNTIRLRDNESYCIVQVLAFSLGCLEWPLESLSSIGIYLGLL
jgi:hypothetical protein